MGSENQNGATNLYDMTKTKDAKVRPALWVKSSAFGFGRTVTGLVWPMVTQELVPGFMEAHAITVELRPSFWEPAESRLSVYAQVEGDDGNGRFTFENVMFGEYVLYISRAGYLVRAMNIEVTEFDPKVLELVPPDAPLISPTDDPDDGVFRLWWGDCNGDFRVDNADEALISHFMSMSTSAYDSWYQAGTDFNGDGRPDNNDLLMLNTKWNYDSSMYAGAETVDFGR